MRERIEVLKCVIVTLALVQNLPAVKRIATVPYSHTPKSSAAIPEMRERDGHMLTYSCILRVTAGRDGHMLTCSCTLPVQLHVLTYPTSTFLKRLANGSLTTYQISAQSTQPFTRYEKGVRSCARVCPTINFCKKSC